ncbi:MAG: non-canonical purine NTP pyrophosphatase [Candidatus Saccharimonadales bacterium]
MKQVVFATSNQRKIAEATETLGLYGIAVTARTAAIDEIQHPDSSEVTKAKARAAFAVLATPVVVADTSWSIPALGGFPGAYMKDTNVWLQPEDWVSLMSRHDDKRILCHEHVAYYDGTTLEHFHAEYTGYFIDTPRGRDRDDESFEKVVILYGNKTMAEQLEAGELASAGEELAHWHRFGEWYRTLEQG